MTWWTQRLVAFDLETTGVDPEEARIVTAAVAYVGGGEPTELRTWLADPGVEIPEEASAVHGITTEKAREEGRPLGEVVTDVLFALGGRPPGAPIVIYNAPYDLTVLDREARRIEAPGALATLEARVVDPLVIDKWLDRYRRGSRNLATACEHYGRMAALMTPILSDAHDAGADALAAARLAWVICQHGQVVRRVRNAQEGREKATLTHEWERVRSDLDLLHAAQIRWAEEQKAGLRTYFAQHPEKGVDPESVSTAWPVIPYEGAARDAR